MCGIAGILYADPSRACLEPRLREMRDTMVHRGPDDAGIHLDGPLGLAHRRLSIIDLSSGHQPMATPDESLWVVFNGEIYNYQALRRELEARGHTFRTHSDTEVLLYAYREWGEAFPEKLNGIFAFAIWDRPKRRLFLARDHMGIKPLYYRANDDAFVFASEIKALLASGHVAPQLNLAALPEYFVFRHVAGEQTLFRDVWALPPGHSMSIEGRTRRLRQYWSPLPNGGANSRNADEALEELSALLENAVQMQRMSDVPLGTFCSGGIDSSLVTAICARQSNTPVNTYSVGFHETEYDETSFARLVAKRYGTEHHELRVGAAQFADFLPTLIWHNDEPLNFANSVQIYAISRLAKERVTVVLTGEGADELFGGYPRYRIPMLVARLQRLPAVLKRLLGFAARSSGERRLQKLAGFLDQSVADSALYNCSPLRPASAQRLRARGDGFAYRSAVLDRLAGESPLRQVALIDQHAYLVSILNRQDKMSMAASIESRVPLLDYRIVEFANRLPDSLKLAGAQTKMVLKRLAERYLPGEVVFRRKSGFGVPLAAWFRAADGLGKLALDSLTDDRLPEFDGELRVQQLLTEHRAGRADHSEALWTALNYVLWKQRFGVA